MVSQKPSLCVYLCVHVFNMTLWGLAMALCYLNKLHTWQLSLKHLASVFTMCVMHHHICACICALFLYITVQLHVMQRMVLRRPFCPFLCQTRGL